MKEGWTYKKLGEVATFINGYPFKPTDWKNNGRKIIRIQNLNNPNATYNFYDGSIDPKYLVSNGDVLISWSGSLGVFEWSEDEAILNQHIFKVVFNKGHINKQFFEYVVASRINEMKSKVHGVTMQHITKKEFDVILIPVPPAAEQERIVAELDLLSGIIEKKKEQLKAYDQLAQSIFYTMFGDPIDNPKGWEVKKLGEIVSVKGRVGWKGYKKEDLRESGPLAIGGGHITENGSMDFSSPVYLSKEKFEESPEIIVKRGDLIMVQRGTIGRIGLIRNEIGDATINPCVLILRPFSVNGVYLLHLLLNKIMQDHICGFVRGVAQPMITQKQVNSLNLPVPPLSLQQEFAEKVEAIERQKALVQQSIEETQTMFDYTMDKYFG